MAPTQPQPIPQPIQLIARFVQREAFVLGIQDALRLTLYVTGLAIIAVFFVRGTRRSQPVPEQAFDAPVDTDSGEAVPVEAMLAG